MDWAVTGYREYTDSICDRGLTRSALLFFAAMGPFELTDFIGLDTSEFLRSR